MYTLFADNLGLGPLNRLSIKFSNISSILQPSEEKNIDKEKSKDYSWLYVVFTLVLVAIIFFIYFVFFRKNKIEVPVDTNFKVLDLKGEESAILDTD